MSPDITDDISEPAEITDDIFILPEFTDDISSSAETTDDIDVENAEFFESLQDNMDEFQEDSNIYCVFDMPDTYDDNLPYYNT